MDFHLYLKFQFIFIEILTGFQMDFHWCIFEIYWYSIEIAIEFQLDLQWISILVSIEFQLDFYWVFIGIPSEIQLDFPWISIGIPLKFQLDIQRISICISLKFQLDFQLIFIGILLIVPLVNYWNFYWMNNWSHWDSIEIAIELKLDFQWISNRISMKF